MALPATPPPGQAGDKRFLRIEAFEIVTVNQWTAESSHIFYLLLNSLTI